MTVAGGSSVPPERSGGAIYLHLLALGALAFAQPLFELLASAPEFFAARGGDRRDVIVVMAVALLGAPLPWLAAAFAARRLLRADAAARVTAGLVGSLVAVVALRGGALLNLGPAGAVGLAAVAGLASGWLYLRTVAARLLATFLVPALAAVPALFLLDPGIARRLEAPPAGIALHTSGGSTPVVVVLLDALSLASLVDASDRVDADRFPHLAALASQSTWFRNAVAPSTSTAVAVPAILSGRLSPAGDRRQKERNLFTLLGDYPTWAVEAWSSLCPREHNLLKSQRPSTLTGRTRQLLVDLPLVWAQLLAPPAWRARLPSLSGGWEAFAAFDRSPGPGGVREVGHLGRRPDLQRFLASIAPAERALYFGHLVLPHGPWEHLPSGRRYDCKPECFPEEGDERWRSAHLYQRYQLQLRYTDAVVGEVVARLRRSGLYDRALLVLLADHGAAFRPGVPDRATVPASLAEVLNVPLLVKRPGQREAVVVDDLVSTTGLPATVAEVLEIEPPWSFEEPSYFRPRGDLPAYLDNDREPQRAPADLAARRRAAREHLAGLAGPAGARDPFEVGPWPELHGRSVEGSAAKGPRSDLRLTLDLPERYRGVDPTAEPLPLLVTGVLTGATRGDGCCGLAVAVDGTVRATTRSYWTAAGTHRFAMLLPERALRPGDLEVAVYEVEESAALPLRRISAGD